MKEKKNLPVKYKDEGLYPRRTFLTRMIDYGKFGFIGAAVLPVESLLLSGCGKLASQTVPGEGESSLSIEVISQIGKDNDGSPMVRANGRDTFEFIATPRGLEGSVGFFLPASWGTFRGGSLSATDGYTYFSVDEDGRARALYVSSTVMGRIELRVKSQYKTILQPLTFDFGTLAIYPSAETIWGVAGEKVTLTVRGARPPVRWATSHPSLIKITPLDDFNAEFEIISDSLFTDTTDIDVTISAWDQEATVPATSTLTIDMGGGLDSSSCNGASLTTNPSAASGATTLSVVLVDSDRTGAASVTVNVAGPGVPAGATLTLPQWNTPGIFQGSYSSAGGAGTYTFTIDDVGEACNLELVSATYTET